MPQTTAHFLTSATIEDQAASRLTRSEMFPTLSPRPGMWSNSSTEAWSAISSPDGSHRSLMREFPQSRHPRRTLYART